MSLSPRTMPKEFKQGAIRRLELGGHLAEVQRQRMWPTKVIKAMQTFVQERLIAPALLAQNVSCVRWLIGLLVRTPILGAVASRPHSLLRVPGSPDARTGGKTVGPLPIAE